MVLSEYMPYIWALALVLCVAVEAASPSLTAIWFMPAGFVCLIMSILSDVGTAAQIATFIVLGTLTLILSRTALKKYSKRNPAIPTNADRVIGDTAIVTSKIINDEGEGEVKINGQLWTARSSDGDEIEKGEKVSILRIEGVKLIVSKLK
ncbi:MAG: NfeD family protein [Firmicutes bacterium]|nr:NfeD family protein [Bacillota bacterium]